MDIAERYGLLLRRLLCSAERFSERAMRRGSSWANTPFSRSSALLVSITCRDQRFGSDFGLLFLVVTAHQSYRILCMSDDLHEETTKNSYYQRRYVILSDQKERRIPPCKGGDPSLRSG